MVLASFLFSRTWRIRVYNDYDEKFLIYVVWIVDFIPSHYLRQFRRIINAKRGRWVDLIRIKRKKKYSFWILTINFILFQIRQTADKTG